MAVLNPAVIATLPRSYLEENIGSRLTITATIFLVVQTIAVILYYISRYITRTLKGYDCWLLMPLGYISCTGLCVLGICKTLNLVTFSMDSDVAEVTVKFGGAGRHVEAVILHDPTGRTLQIRSKIDKGVEFLDYAAITGSKLVILTLYMRIFNKDRRYRIATYFVGVIILLTLLAGLIATLAICQPFSAYWNHHIPGAKCGNIITFWRFISVPNITTDLMMLVLPLPALYKLHVKNGTKIWLFITFTVGSM